MLMTTKGKKVSFFGSYGVVSSFLYDLVMGVTVQGVGGPVPLLPRQEPVASGAPDRLCASAFQTCMVLSDGLYRGKLVISLSCNSVVGTRHEHLAYLDRQEWEVPCSQSASPRCYRMGQWWAPNPLCALNFLASLRGP